MEDTTSETRVESLLMIFSLRHIITILVLAYPLIYSVPCVYDSGGAYENGYFLLVFAFLLLILAKEFDGCITFVKYKRLNILFFTFLVIVTLNTYDFHYAKPLAFLLYTLAFVAFISKFEIRLSPRYGIGGFYLYVLVSLIFFLFSDRIGVTGRFVGFASSPTTFSTFLQAVFLLGFFSTRNNKLRLLMFLASTVLIYLSKTRLNMIYQFSLVPLYILYSVLRVHKGLLYLGFLVPLIALYPIYDVYCNMTASAVTLSRYDDDNGDDKSFLLRIAMSKTIFDDFVDGDTSKMMLGHGTEKARELISKQYGEDLQPHNDFLRFAYDYGILGFLVFTGLLYTIALINPLLFFLTLLYNVSFYHNMAFSYYIPSILIIVLLGAQRYDSQSDVAAV